MLRSSSPIPDHPQGAGDHRALRVLQPHRPGQAGELTAPLTTEGEGPRHRGDVAWLDEQPQRPEDRNPGLLYGGLYTFLVGINHPTRVGAAGSFHGGGWVTDKADSVHLQVGKAKAGFLVAIAEDDDVKQPGEGPIEGGLRRGRDPAVVEVYPANMVGA